MKRSRVIACVVAGLFVLALAVHAAGEVNKLSGKVTFICPQHRAIKVECLGGKTWTLWVDQNAGNADTVRRQIQQLQVGDSVTVHYYARDGKNYIRELEKTG